MQIDQQLCRIQQLKREQRTNYVPIAVYRGLEQYLKETEVDHLFIWSIFQFLIWKLLCQTLHHVSLDILS